MIILNSIIAIIRLILIMAALTMYYLYFLLGKPFHRQQPMRWGMKMQRRFQYVATAIFQTRIRRIGEAPAIAGLVVSNHRAIIDPIIILRHLSARTVAKAEVRGYPILGKAALDTGTIFVKREDKASRGRVKDTIIEHLKEGWSILIFPEGTTSDAKTTKPFFKGSFERAVAAGVPILPIALIYDDRRYHWEDGGLMKYYLSNFGWKTPNVTIVFCDPIVEEDGIKAADLARQVISEAILRYRAK